MHPFWRFLDGLREKPQAVRTQFAFLGALTFTFLIGLIWVSTLPAQFASLSENAKNNEVTAAVGEVQNKVANARNADATSTPKNAAPAYTPTTTLNFQPANFTSPEPTPSAAPMAPEPATSSAPVIIETTKSSGQPIMIETTPSPKTQ